MVSECPKHNHFFIVFPPIHALRSPYYQKRQQLTCISGILIRTPIFKMVTILNSLRQLSISSASAIISFHFLIARNLFSFFSPVCILTRFDVWKCSLHFPFKKKRSSFLNFFLVYKIFSTRQLVGFPE